MSRFSDFGVCSSNLYIWSIGVYIQGLDQLFEVEIHYVNSSDRTKTIFQHCYA